MCHGVNDKKIDNANNFWKYAIEQTGNLRAGSFHCFMNVRVPTLVSKITPFMTFDHVQYDDVSKSTPRAHIFCTFKSASINIASIPIPLKNGENKLKFKHKIMVFEESLANNVPIVMGEHSVRIRIKDALSTKMEQMWDITWKHKQQHFLLKQMYEPANSFVIKEPSDISAATSLLQDLRWLPTELRKNALVDLLERIKDGFTISRDDLQNKRILLPHHFMTIIFIRQLRKIKYIYERKQKIITCDLFRYAYLTGNWKYGKVGVVQSSTSHNTIAKLSELRKVRVSTTNTACKGTSTRKLRASHFGFYCCVETTEGATCGLIRQLAITATVSDTMSTRKCLQHFHPATRGIRVYINELFVGIGEFDTNNLPKHVCYYRDGPNGNRMFVNCDGGRLVRPVRIENTIRFIDSSSQASLTFQELCSYSSLGLIPALLPFLHHNQSPRSMYATQMLKQGVMSNETKKLWYPQTPLVSPFDSQTLKSVNLYVQNVVIAVLCTTGHNQEDSLIISKRAFDFGMFRHDQFTWNTNTLSTKKGLASNEHWLDSDGYPFIGSDIDSMEKILGNGTRNKTPFTTNIEEVELSYGGVRVKSRQTRIPQQGDKFCSMHGQKGICGRVEPPENLPFTRQGITPDIIINPHAFPSRMTIGQLLETVVAKSLALGKKLPAPTPFAQYPTESIDEALRSSGFSTSGKERMYDGQTGVPLSSTVFIGVASYMRLKHLVDDKIFARSNDGPIDSLTNQPVSGRSRGGGLRIGEMEKDCLIAHGAFSTLREKFMLHSDQDHIHWCPSCGNFESCSCASPKPPIVEYELPTATKLLIRELKSVNIKLKLFSQ